MEIPASLGERIEEARRRLQSHHRWRAWLTYSMPVCGVCLALAIVSRVIYFPYSSAIVAACAAFGLAAAAVAADRIKVDRFTAAARLDLAEGLKERLSTVTECAGEDGTGEVMEALLVDAVAAAKDCAPARSLVFRAPYSLPVTLGLAIAVIALVLAPRAFGRSESSLPAIERIALHESIRLNATLRLLDERNIPGEIKNPMKKIKEELENGNISSARQRLAAFRTRIEEQIAQAEEKDGVLDEMRESEALSKLAELLSTSAAPQAVAEEAATRFDENLTDIKEAIRDILDRLDKDSELRKEIEEAFEAARENDAQAFAAAMEKLGRKIANLPGAGDLKMARARLESLDQKLSGAGDSGTPDTAGPGRTGAASEGTTAVPEIAAQTALDEAMEREKVPERFRNLVKVYFARSEENARR